MPTTSAAEQHRQWLELLDIEGPFLAVPPLKRVWPNGIPDFRANHPDRFAVFADARKDFESAWEALDRDPGNEASVDAYRATRDSWVETLLRDVVGWAESLQWGTVAGIEARSPNRAVTVTGQAALVGDDGIGALVYVIDPTDSLRHTPSDLWAATPVDRLEALLRQNDVAIGVVTDGRWWGLVHAGAAKMPASGVADALTWTEEPRARDAFLTLLGRQHIIGGDPAERLPALFDESVAAAEDITEALGAQVRRAVELLIQSFSESAADARRRRQPDPLPERTHDTYEAAVTVMMRTVFLLFAEERGLLPSGELFEQGYGVSGELDRLVAESASGEEALEATALAWHRLLATSRALFSGASFENMRMPAYGGSLFDPNRFPFLMATDEHGALAVRVSDRVMLHVLRSLQIANVKGEARRISFRDVDVEQIGYIYEGLLGYTCVKVDQPVLGILGTTGSEPEIPLATLEDFAAETADPKKLAATISAWVDEDQPSAKPSSVAAIAKAIQSEPEPSAISALTQMVRDDTKLHERVLPWLGLVRRDLRDHPFVVLEDGLLVKETPSRRNAGAHYTPKSLAEEVVLHALQPLCYSPGPHQTDEQAEWKLKTSDEILGLKVADIACGSGAFLVASARYLAERLVEAWTSEDPANAQRSGLYTRAIRQVVANCLFGADINEMAVEMCKLSLWLVSLDRHLPFSFVDDKVFLGNSLLGLTSLDQLRNLHIDPKHVLPDRRFDIFEADIESVVRKAVDLRERLATEINEDDPARSSSAKNRQLNELRLVTSSLRQVADAVIAGGLPVGGKPGKALDDAYEMLREAVKRAQPSSSGETTDMRQLAAIIARGLTPTVATDYERWKPLHWVIEAPDVIVEHGGFDAVVGNPPFLGGLKLSGAMGDTYRDWLVNVLAGGARGAADLVAYFFLRASELVRRDGCLGLIATNTIAQGDTREVGLDQIVDRGFEIYRAIQSRPWPAASAGVNFASVWIVRSSVHVNHVADGVSCSRISTLLEAGGRTEGRPVRLAENAELSFIGCYPLGSGFVVDKATADAWIADSTLNREVLKPYLTGEDLNSTPKISTDKWIIDFNERSQSEAARYSLPFSHVETYVRPERARNSDKSRREVWWRFTRPAPGLRAAIAGLDWVACIRQTSPTLQPLRVRTGSIFDQTMTVMASDSFAFLAIISSSIHVVWVIQRGVTLGSGPRYTPSDVFETFPRPVPTARLEDLGVVLDEGRREVMVRRQLGLTKLYSLVNDPSILGDDDVTVLREIHAELDEAVMDAYGWSDVPLGHGFHTYRQMERWTVSPEARVEILDRLLEENHRRAALEVAQAELSLKGRKRKAESKGMEEMFE